MPSRKVIYRQRDILLTKFPFSNLVGSKVRPVLVLSNDVYNRQHRDLLICAVTSCLRTNEYASSLTTGDLEQGALKIESKEVRADTITSIRAEDCS
jgi:mRNA interferase MazF